MCQRMHATALKNSAILIRNAIVPILLVVQAVMMPTQVRANDYLQCVPFARELSGIQIYGDAHSWWDQAAGKYQRGTMPVEGAVLSLPSHGAMQLGHVAVVRDIVDDRNILISHANWSPINGKRGQIERRVAAQDVSARNDWSLIRIWYAPIENLGTTVSSIQRTRPRQMADSGHLRNLPARAGCQIARFLIAGSRPIWSNPQQKNGRPIQNQGT